MKFFAVGGLMALSWIFGSKSGQKANDELAKIVQQLLVGEGELAQTHADRSRLVGLDFALSAQSVLRTTLRTSHTRMAVGMSEEAVPFLLEGISFFGPKIWV